MAVLVIGSVSIGHCPVINSGLLNLRAVLSACEEGMNFRYTGFISACFMHQGNGASEAAGEASSRPKLTPVCSTGHLADVFISVLCRIQY